MRLQRKNQNGVGPSEADVLLQLQFGQELARRYEQEHIAIELRAADVAAREARIAELTARVTELEEALAQAVADERRRAASMPEPGHEADDADSAGEPSVAVILRRPRGRRLGKELLKHRIVTKRALRDALNVQARTGAPLGEILVAQGAISPDRLLQVLADHHGVTTVGADDRAIALLPAPMALELRAVALAVGAQPVAPGAMTAVAMVDIEVAPTIASALKRPIEPRLTDAQTMMRLFANAYTDAQTVPVGLDLDAVVEPDPVAEPVPAETAVRDAAPIVVQTREPVATQAESTPELAPVAAVAASVAPIAATPLVKPAPAVPAGPTPAVAPVAEVPPVAPTPPAAAAPATNGATAARAVRAAPAPRRNWFLRRYRPASTAPKGNGHRPGAPPAGPDAMPAPRA
jgi:hypothetical protein